MLSAKDKWKQERKGPTLEEGRTCDSQAARMILYENQSDHMFANLK